MSKQKAIIYVNFSPYENAGNILDFIFDNFSEVHLFSFDFHKINSKNVSEYRIYTNKRLAKNIRLLTIPMPEALIFFLLPFRSLLIVIQLIWYIHLERKKIKRPVIYFTVNAFTAWVGYLLKKLGYVDKTVFWVWDYYPPFHPQIVVRLMRRLYWQFDKTATKSDNLIFLNQRLVNLHKKIGAFKKGKKYSVVPIGTNPIKAGKTSNQKPLVLGFFGVLKISQGLDIILDNFDKIQKFFPQVRLEIIGSGPDLDYYQEKSYKFSDRIKFYGFVSSDNQINNIIAHWSIGVAPYKPEPSNVSYFGDPSKIKRFLSLGIPVVATDVFDFAKEIKKSEAGVIISYDNPNELIDAIRKIILNYNRYSKSATVLARKYKYDLIYPQLFKFENV